MTWDGVNEFLAMGGYGLYVWGSYGMALVCISLEVYFLTRATMKTEA